MATLARVKQFTGVCSLLSIAGIAVLWAQAPPDVLRETEAKLNDHDLNGAYELLHAAAERAPESADIAAALGRVEYLRGNFVEAEKALEKAVQLDDNCGRGWVGLGRVFEAASLRDKAKVCYRKAYLANPRDPEVQRYYARTLTPVEQLAALEAYLANGAEKDDPENADQARRQVISLKSVGNRALFKLVSPLEHTEVKLSHLMYDPHRIRGFALPVRFNGGKPLRLLMDSGAGGIVLNRKAAETAGMSKIADTRFWGIGDEGDRTGYTALADKVQIGEVVFENCPVAVSEKKFLTDEDGLIGTDVFSRFLVTLDWQKMVLKLDPLPPFKNPPRDPRWPDREIPPEFSRFTPFWRSGHAILLPVRVNGSKPVLFLVDTGAGSSLIDPVFARQFTSVGSEDRITMKGVSGKVAKVQNSGQLSFEFGHYRQPVPGVLAIPLAKVSHDSPSITGIFGMTTLIDFRMQIDYRDGLLNLEYVGPK